MTKRLYRKDYGLFSSDADVKEFSELAKKAGIKLAKFASKHGLDLRDADHHAQSQINTWFTMEMLQSICPKWRTK